MIHTLMAWSCWIAAIAILIFIWPSVVVLWRWIPAEFFIVNGGAAAIWLLIIAGTWLWFC